jgi:hypothetical protein
LETLLSIPCDNVYHVVRCVALGTESIWNILKAKSVLILKSVDESLTMSLRNRSRNMPRNLPPIKLPQNLEILGSSIGNTKNLTRGANICENNIDAENISGGNQNLLNGPKSPDLDYIETDFRYLAIGSPAPILGLDQAMPIPDVAQDSEPDYDDLFNSTRLAQTSSSRHHDNSNKDNTLGVGARPKDKLRRGVSLSNPAIKVDRCDENIQDDERTISYNCREDSADDSSRGDESPGRGLGSPNTSSLLLDPSPPMCRKRHNVKVVTYYQPSLTCSRSEGSIRRAVHGGQTSTNDSTECIPIEAVGSGFHNNARSSSCSPISVANTQVLLSPLANRKNTMVRSFPVTSDSRVSQDSSSQRSTISTPSSSASPMSPTSSGRRSGQLEPLSYSRSSGYDTDGRLPPI